MRTLWYVSLHTSSVHSRRLSQCCMYWGTLVLCRTAYTINWLCSNTKCGPQKMSQFFSGFHKKLARTKTKQSTDKANEHNDRIVFLWALVLRGHQREWFQLCLIIYLLFIKIPHNLCQLIFSPPPLPPTEYATHFGLLGHTKAYNCVTLWPPTRPIWRLRRPLTLSTSPPDHGASVIAIIDHDPPPLTNTLFRRARCCLPPGAANFFAAATQR